MKVLFIEAPAREENKVLPFGLLYTAGAVIRCNHQAKIIDYGNEKFSFLSLAKTINEYKPDLIGLSGITASYKNLKRYTMFLKNEYPKLPLVVGGVISSISNLLLTKAKADMVVHCEGEVVIPSILKYYQGEMSIDEIPGISYLRDGTIIRNKNAQQIESLDDIPFPPYHLLNMNKYLCLTREWVDFYFRYDNEEKQYITKRLEKFPYIFDINTSRGCTQRCIFCYRHMKGIRQHSVNYVIEHIKYLKNKYNVGFYKFADELTTVNKKWVIDFCDSLEKEKLDINFIVLSAKTNTVDEEMLRRLKGAGCVMLNFGFESGSDTILKRIGKGTTKEDNIRAGLLVKKVGIKNIPELMIGFPNETDDTINETIDFLKVIYSYPFSVNYVLPFPETPLWHHCIDKNLIVDIEEFVLNYKEARFLQVNLTNMPDKIVRNWMTEIMYEVRRPYLIKNKNYFSLAKLELRKRTNNEVWDFMSISKNKLMQKLRSIKNAM